MNKTNPSVDGYIRKSKEWQNELQKLRAIILEHPLTEEVKWRVPCYTYEGKLVLFLGRFKNACVLSFAKGALLKDAQGVLIQQTENSQSVRIIRFPNSEMIDALKPILHAYIAEAMKAADSGLKVAYKTTSEFKMPDEFKVKLDERPVLKKAFAALTPGRQRAYLLHFGGAKQSKTRASRVEKWMPTILRGKGMDDE